jgi:pre-mRNA-splicing factor ATP-dependent RNA helicase DHX15/PRP43
MKAQATQQMQEDPNVNPLTGDRYSQRYWQIMEKRKTLPCAAAKKKFLKMVHKNQVMVLVGETGSGTLNFKISETIQNTR